MVEGQHRVGLAAAENGLELYGGIATFASETLSGVSQETDHAVGQVGALEELYGVLVFGVGGTVDHLGQVGGELGLLVASLAHVWMRVHDLPPGEQALRASRHNRGLADDALHLP